MIAVVQGVLIHCLLAISGRHDGRGLPVKPNAAVLFLFALTVLASLLRHHWLATDPYPVWAIVFSVGVMAMFWMAVVGARHFVLVPLSMCISMAVDLMACVFMMVERPISSSALSALELMLIAVCVLQYARRMRLKDKAHKADR